MAMGAVDIAHLKKGEVDLGTSIMAVKFDGGVVIGADSRRRWDHTLRIASPTS